MPNDIYQAIYQQASPEDMTQISIPILDIADAINVAINNHSLQLEKKPRKAKEMPRIRTRIQKPGDRRLVCAGRPTGRTESGLEAAI
jgi:hypothetical protein